MAIRKKKKKKRNLLRVAKIGMTIFAALLIFGLAAFGQRYIVRLSLADVYLKDLPEAFEGMRVVYAANLLTNGLRSPEAYRSLIHQIEALKPDIILLGGGYSKDPKDDSSLLGLFNALGEIGAPCGKFAIMDEFDDADWAAGYLPVGGFRLLSNEVMTIDKEGARILICGSTLESARLREFNEIAGGVRDEDCAILISPIADAFPAINTHTARGGGMIADLVLSVHSPSENPSERYRQGNYFESGTAMIVSGGIEKGGGLATFFSAPEIHLLTLRRPEVTFYKDSAE